MNKNARPIEPEILPAGAVPLTPRQQPQAPVRLEVNLWPAEVRAEAVVQYANGHRQALEIASPTLRMILAALRAAGVQI